MNLILIPTYNEADNVEKMTIKLLEYKDLFDILFIDDNSPDGTGEILKNLSSKYKNINILHRDKKEGIGSAHLEGLIWAYDNKYKYVVTIDCDFTHSPDNIINFFNCKNEADLIIGTRFHGKGGLHGWSIIRKLVTYVGHFLTILFLNIKYDATGAFRLYNISVIPKQIFLRTQSKGYNFFFKSIFLINFNNFKIKQIPIVLSARAAGHSKMSYSDIFIGITELIIIFFVKTFNKSKYKI